MQAKLQFVTEHEDKDLTSWRNVLWPDEPKFEQFGYNDYNVVWTKKRDSYKLKKTIPTETEAWQHNVIIRKEIYVETLMQKEVEV